MLNILPSADFTGVFPKTIEDNFRAWVCKELQGAGSIFVVDVILRMPQDEQKSMYTCSHMSIHERELKTTTGNAPSLTVIVYCTEVVSVEELLIVTDSVGSIRHLKRKENSKNKKVNLKRVADNKTISLTVSCLISAPGAFEIENESLLLLTVFLH